ncbi:MAG: alpha/beta fold hydrolase [Gammaproteobacteria bacterium]
MANELGPAYQPCSYPHPLDSTQDHQISLPYADYIAKMREIITQNRCDLESSIAPNWTPNMIIDANSPHQHLPPPTATNAHIGILIIHGLFDSPYSMLNIYEYFAKQNYTVRSLLLPGHGTRAGDLLRVTYQDWIRTVRYAVNSFKEQVNYLYLVGYSTGGTLALHHILTEHHTVTGVVTLAPALKLKNVLTHLAPWHDYIFVWGEHREWFSIQSEIDIGRYRSIPYNAVKQIYLLSRRVIGLEQAWTGLSIPQYMILTADDEVIDSTYAKKNFQQYATSNSELLWYCKHPTVTIDPRIIQQYSSCFEQHILDFSHCCITVAPEHPFYGKEGYFRDMQHYQNRWGQWLFSQHQYKPLYFGAVTLNNLFRYHLCRLGYNPYFLEMIKSIEQFIQKHAKDN